MKKHQYIMAVDDEQTVLRLLKRTLEPEGYDVIVADNGRVSARPTGGAKTRPGYPRHYDAWS